ncbi:hypothetical protein Zm00014a_017422, partial [Zea mays]
QSPPEPFPRRRWSSTAPLAPVSSALASATRNAPQFPLPSLFSLPALTRRSPCSRHRRPGSPSRPRRRRGVPGARLEVTDLSRPYRPLFCSLLRLIARRSRETPPPSRPAVNRPPPVPLPRPKPYRRTPRAPPTSPTTQVTPEPRQSPAPRLRRVLRRGDERRRPS